MILIACAQRVPITGGPNDVLPPRLVKSDPDTFSTRFNSTKIKLEFDEFVQINNAFKNVLITPVLKKRPIVLANGKKVTIKNFDDTLKPNSTYVIEFNEAIRDITENNSAVGFRYVFSTGDYVDSLLFKGQIKDAFTLEPVKGAFVFLYDSDYDSIPYKEIPRYIGRSNDNGVFKIKNMKEGHYKVFVCSDENGNYLYDKPTEVVDFSDSPRHVSADTVEPFFAYVFKEDLETQFLKSSGSTNHWSFYLIFNKSIDTLNVFADEKNKPVYSFIPEYNEKRDSVVFYVPDSSYHLETLTFMIQVDTFPRDTVEITFKKELKPSPMRIRKNLTKNEELGLGKNLVLSFGIPVGEVDKEKIHLFRDTIPVDFLLSKRKAGKELEIKADWKPDKFYSLVLDSASVSDLIGRSNDSIKVTFKTLKEEYYGSLEINLDIEPADGILIIMDEANKVKEQVYLKSSNTHYFQYMEPGKYKLKYIVDGNSNRKWDSGNYLKAVHAERVHIYQGTITVRSNWDQAIEWKMN